LTEPDPERVAVYDERYAAYRDLIRRVRDEGQASR